MQTFLPDPNFRKSAEALDRARLGKQRVETLQIMQALRLGKGWVNHPAVKMWYGYEWTLLHYQKAMVNEWLRRGYKDTCFRKTFDLYFMPGAELEETNQAPPWLGNKAFHVSHQSNLIRKDPFHYGALYPGVRDDLPYIWPEG